jgi:glycerophosphoryl diester phosphodiesterase/MFS family permease
MDSSASRSNRLRWITLIVLTSINILNYIDRNIFAALIPVMKTDLHFSDTAFGWLGSAFILSYTIIAPLFGYIGDRGPRTKTMSMGLLLWSAATAFTGWTRSFVGQFTTRVTVGFGEAAYSVISPTVISDHFSKAVRGKTFAIYSCAIPVGSALGYVLGGWLEPIFGWQRTFYVVGVPGILLTFVLFFLPDPKRGAQEDPQELAAERALPEHSFAESYRKLFGNGGFMLTVLGYAAYTFVVGGLSFWMPSYIVRYFDGVSLSHGNYVFGLVTVAGGFVGTVLGGFISDRIEKRSGNGYMKVAVLSMVLSVPLFWYVLSIRDFNHFAKVLFFLDVVLFMCISPLDAAVVGYVRPKLRSTAMALNIFLIHALGDGISRGLMGQISDAHGLQAAMGMMPWILALAGLLWFFCMIFQFQPMLWPESALSLPLFQAHRGYRPAGVQENTLDSFRRARAAGADMCECDVQLTSDGEIIVFHDEDLKRLGGSDDLVKSLTAAEMKSRVNAPTLRELLTDAGCPPKVNIELKTGEARGRSGLEREVVRIVRECKAENRVLFSSFNPLALGRIAKLAPEIPRGLLVTEENEPKNKIYLKRMWLGVFARPNLLHLDQNMINRGRLDSWSERHLKVAAWTVNDAGRAEELAKLGVVSLITDHLYVKPLKD